MLCVFLGSILVSCFSFHCFSVSFAFPILEDRLSCSRLTRSSLAARAPIRLNMPFRGALLRPQIPWDPNGYWRVLTGTDGYWRVLVTSIYIFFRGNPWKSHSRTFPEIKSFQISTRLRFRFWRNKILLSERRVIFLWCLEHQDRLETCAAEHATASGLGICSASNSSGWPIPQRAAGSDSRVSTNGNRGWYVRQTFI